MGGKIMIWWKLIILYLFINFFLSSLAKGNLLELGFSLFFLFCRIVLIPQKEYNEIKNGGTE